MKFNRLISLHLIILGVFREPVSCSVLTITFKTLSEALNIPAIVLGSSDALLYLIFISHPEVELSHFIGEEAKTQTSSK